MTMTCRTIAFNLGIVAAWGLVAALSTVSVAGMPPLPPPLPPPHTLVIEEVTTSDDEDA